MSQIKMEQAFIKELAHLLSKKYKYFIVADRGFGHDRFAQYCINVGFDIVLRTNKNLNLYIKDEQNNESNESNLKETGKKCNLKDFDKTDKKFIAYVESWKRNYYLETVTEKDSTWFLMSNTDEFNMGEIYEKRFRIETCYKDYKSNGYDLEKVKIKKI